MAVRSKMASTPNFKEKVYEIVKLIPKGKVTTYGQITLRLRSGSATRITPRLVGWVLHANKSTDVPCHRVVNRNGRIAKSYAFGGAVEQRKRLKAEGVEFVDKMHVDLADGKKNSKS